MNNESNPDGTKTFWIDTSTICRCKICGGVNNSTTSICPFCGLIEKFQNKEFRDKFSEQLKDIMKIFKND